MVVGLSFPDDLHYLVEEQVWARLAGDGTATVGITSLGIALAGEVFMCRPKSVGQVIERGRAVAVVELAKSIVAVKSPVTGTVLAINEALAGRPEQVSSDPYGQGWIARLRLTDEAAERAALLHGPAVAVAMQRHAWLHQVPGAEAPPP
jgi:glycine cleavage system H protein